MKLSIVSNRNLYKGDALGEPKMLPNGTYDFYPNRKTSSTNL